MKTIIIFQGNTHSVKVNIVDKSTGDPYDLTGTSSTVYLAIKNSRTKSPVILKESAPEDIDGGTVTFELDEADTETSGSYVYEVTLTNDSITQTVITGYLQIRESVVYNALQ